jgi:DNA-binding XRE family transcriptional regulator
MAESSRKESPLEVLRMKAGVTQEAISDALGVTDHSYRNWVKGRSEAKLTIRQVKALCRILNCSLEDLPDDFFEQ